MYIGVSEQCIMKLIVGLGNPGKEYEKTRHNLGFMVIDALAGRLGLLDGFKMDKKFNAEIARKGDLIFAKPQTFMNESGRAVQAIAQYFKIHPEEILIVHDDKDMELGKIRLRDQGSSGGHRGIASIIQALGTENFSRLKLGVKGKREISDTSKFVLQKFSLFEKNKAKQLVEKATEKIIKEIIKDNPGVVSQTHEPST